MSCFSTLGVASGCRALDPDGRMLATSNKQDAKSAPSGNQTRVWSVAGTYTITVLTALNVLMPRIELGTSCVLSRRHNQLDHTSWFGVSGFRSQYLVLAKDARFRLRQYPAVHAGNFVVSVCCCTRAVKTTEDTHLSGFEVSTKKLHVRESNPGRLRDRQKCYQLHQHGHNS